MPDTARASCSIWSRVSRELVFKRYSNVIYKMEGLDTMSKHRESTFLEVTSYELWSEEGDGVPRRTWRGVMEEWWRDDGEVVEGWWRDDGGMMEGWWMGDGGVMEEWCRDDGEVVEGWWRDDGGMMEGWWMGDGGVMERWCRDGGVMEGWWRGDGGVMKGWSTGTLTSAVSTNKPEVAEKSYFTYSHPMPVVVSRQQTVLYHSEYCETRNYFHSWSFHNYVPCADSSFEIYWKPLKCPTKWVHCLDRQSELTDRRAGLWASSVWSRRDNCLTSPARSDRRLSVRGNASNMSVN